MTTFTADQIALQQHIETENAKWIAQCEARGATFYTTIISTPTHWEGYGITTIEQYERHSIIGSIWDCYKEVNGIRPRWMNLDNMSMDELREIESRLLSDMQREHEEEERISEAAIQTMIECGAPDRKTAERWVADACEGGY